ncbi:MAG: hypothetical protein DME82_05820 [Verrucomicrobia bacterium]|nr:MAG: hypothetical protein DME82_05820 [Verrucomicrobiota bacterium]
MSVIALAVLTPPSQGSAVFRVDQIIGLVCDADVNLYFALFARLPEYLKFEMPPFRIGPLRADKLRYNCERADSDYYSRYESRISSAWVIERAPRPVRVLNVPRVGEFVIGDPQTASYREPWELHAWESIVEGYFSLQNSVLFNEFWTEFTSVQTPLVALGAPFFSPRPLNSLIRSEQIAVFLNLGPGGKGFVSPAGSGPELVKVELANAQERIPKAVSELERSYNFQAFDDSPLHRAIRIFAEFVVRAIQHDIDGRSNEALLHFVIALELIFGEPQTIQRSVSERVALITCRENGKSFDQQRAWVEQIYDLRSRYVHSGVDIENKLPLEQLRAVCQQVFKCLMRLQAAYPQRQSRNDTVLKGWLRDLDYLAKGMIAGKQPDDRQLKDAFIT